MTPEEARHLRRAKDLVDRGYAQPLDVAALAGEAHISPHHFIRRFKQAYGDTPHQYVLTRRVERAQELLRNTDLSVSEICLEVGFQSLGSFSAAFRRVAGMTPTAYRATVEGHPPAIPGCWAAQWTRPQTAGMEKRPGGIAGSIVAMRIPIVALRVLDQDRALTFYTDVLGFTPLQEPMERFYGIDAAFRDDSGNHVRMTQRVQTGVAPPA